MQVNQELNTNTTESHTRKEIFNFTKKESFEKFVEVTNDSKELKDFFVNPIDDLENESKRLLHSMHSTNYYSMFQ